VLRSLGIAVLLVACASGEPPPRHATTPPDADGRDAPEAKRPKKPLTCEERLAPALAKAKDERAKLEVYEHACDDHCVAACDRASILFMLSFATDSAKDSRYFWRDCELGSAVACALLGDRYKGGRGVTVDPEKALELYERACGEGSSLGCSGQARMLDWASTEADNVQKLDEKAAELNGQHCKQGDPFYCTLLADAYKDGRGLPKDIKRAIELYESACKSGQKRACDTVKSMGP
jgi:TPR repeat protein